MVAAPGVDVRVFAEPHEGVSHPTLLSAAVTAQEAGFSGFFRSDHYLPETRAAASPAPTDAWVSLAALARETRLRLGTLVSPVTFRLPGPLAVIVAQVDAISGGRAELGLGAGWYEAEHTAYGIPFPPRAERFERLEEQLVVIRGLWQTPREERFSFRGRHYELRDAPGLASPAQPRGVPLIIGGRGQQRTPALAARFADEHNVPFVSPTRVRELFERAHRACWQIGRDPRTLVPSATVTVCCGATDGELGERRARVMQHRAAFPPGQGAWGRPAEVTESLREYVRAGARRLYLQFLDLDDLDHLRLVGAEVLPGLRTTELFGGLR